MKRTINRRVWSRRCRRGITDVLEFSTQQAGIVGTVTLLEIWGMPPNYRSDALAPYYMGQGVALADVIARNQDDAQ